jgi:2-amino-4-hydroxy-6-hydroxymethyldihydropteridine diphosphokinase
MHRIYISLGSNCGDSFENLKAAKHAMSNQMRILQCSSIYESPALLPENAPAEWDTPFLNAVIAAETDLEPLAVLEFLKAIEQQLGRQHRGHWAPREIDLDILMMEGVEVQTDLLTIPHKEMLKRDFVMVPLSEISHHSTLASHTLKKCEDLCL